MSALEESGASAAIKDLFLHLNPMIHIAGSSENTLEMLLFLAEMDPNFHKLELVKGIRKALRETLTTKIETLVNAYLEEYAGKMREENAVDYLADEIFQDKGFLDFKSNFENLIKEAVNEMTIKAQSNSFKDMFTDDENEDEYLVNKISPVSSNETSLNSSLNQSGFLFLNPAQYNSIAESLKKKHLYENLHNSLDLLLTVTPGEPVSQPLWPSIRKSLREFLQSEDDELFDKSLRFHAKLLSSQVHDAVKEGFLNLVESLSGFWLSKKLIQRVPFKSLVITVEENKIFIIMKILVQFLKEFPSVWIRYSAKNVTEMIDLFFSIFTIHVTQKGEERMSFLDMLCLINPKASWFHAWTHGQLGRKKTFDALKSKSSLLSSSLSFCFNYLEEEHDLIEEQFTDTLNLDCFRFLKFNYCLSILFCIIRYSDGRELFPIYDLIRKDHFTLKKVLHVFVTAIKPLKQTLVSKVLLKRVSHFSDSKENLCKLFCELGIVDSFIEILVLEEHLNKNTELKTWYFRSVLEFFVSINSTSVGHEYLLTGKLNKTSSKAPLILSAQTPAHKIFAFTKSLITCKHSMSAEVVKISVTLSCYLLQSPFGRHMFINNSLITDLMLYLQAEFNVGDKRSPVQVCQTDLRAYFEEHFEYVIEKLLLSHRGLLIMERNNVLSHVLNLVLPDLAMKGKVSCKLLNSIVSSQQGCNALGQNFIVKPFWEMMEHIMKTESLLRPPLQFEELNEALEEALIPLLCISSTYEGIKLLHSKAGLLEELNVYLLNPQQQETDHYSLALKLLGSSASNLDGILFLEASLSLQETLLKQQNERMTNGEVIIDENSVVRSHILTSTYIPKGTGKFQTHPFIIDDEFPSKISMVHSLPLHSRDKGEKSVKGPSLKKQSELWRFLNDTRTGLHDSTWLIHCRRAYRAELLTSEETKAPLLMELVELCLGSLAHSSDEILPDSSYSQCDVGEDLPSPISTSFSNSVFCFPPSSEPSSPSEEFIPTYGSGINKTESRRDVVIPKDDAYTPSSLGTEMMIRYGSELNLIPDNAAQRSNLLKLKIATNAYFLNNKYDRFDWFSILFYCLTGGSVEKTFTILRKLRCLKVGAIIWPSVMGCLWTSYEMAPNEFLFSSVIHCTKLVLFRDSPVAFLALENIGGGIIWNLVSEWVNQSFVGVLLWPENLHMLLVPLLHGGDYLVYGLVCLLLHLHRNLIERTSQSHFKKIIYLQSEIIETWKVQEHFSYMDSLSKRFRRIVMDTLMHPLTNLRYDYTIKQI